MEHHNMSIAIVIYESRSFWEDCDKCFSQGEEFIVTCDEKMVDKYKKPIKLYLTFEREQPKGLTRLMRLAKIWLVGIGVSGLLGVCIRAKHFGWVIVSDGLPDNQLLHIKPR